MTARTSAMLPKATLPTFTPVPRGLLQRKCTCGGTPGSTDECEECKKKRLQRKASQPSTLNPVKGRGPNGALRHQPSEVPPIVHEVLRSPGQPLDLRTRAIMEPRFGHDFSHVRVHTHAKAAESARAVNALAYTVGRNVVFGEGKYVPQTSEGQRLLAHELTHVVQQGSRVGTPRSLEIGLADNDYEQEANRMAAYAGFEHRATQMNAQPQQLRKARFAVQRQALAAVHSQPDTSVTTCPGYQQGEVAISHTESGHLNPDVTLEPGRLIIADFGVDWRHVKTSTQREPLLRSWLSIFESDSSYQLRIVGYSDCAGPEGNNTDLRQGRAARIEALLGASARSRVRFRGMAALGAYINDNSTKVNRARNRAVVIEFQQEFAFPAQTITASPQTEDIKVVVKSYIASIGARIGSPTCSYPLPVPSPTPFVPPSLVWPRTRLADLAAATDLMMSENPLADAKDKGYRLYTARTFSVTHSGRRLISVVPTPLDTDSGTEGPLQAPPLTLLKASAKRSGTSTFDFSWAVKGRPHPAVEPGFQLVCPRSSVYIWHTVSGRMDCGSSPIRVTAPIAGSQFPSHRVFVRGAPVSTIPQGPFSNLWISSASDPTMVK